MPVRRVLHVRDATGREINRVLWERVSPMPNVRIQAHARALALITEDGRCAGVEFLQEPADRPYGVEAVCRDNSGNWMVLVEQKAYAGQDFAHS